jgi:hypothetical protein
MQGRTVMAAEQEQKALPEANALISMPLPHLPTLQDFPSQVHVSVAQLEDVHAASLAVISGPYVVHVAVP